uniref:VTT domain-containing protein n=2 Tax=Aplanochytrium stocchinoi TaxID=215587 RepID=A0A7S3V1S7_9STRA
MLLKNYGLALLDVPMRDYVLAGIITGFPSAVLWALLGAASHNLSDIVEGKQSIWSVLPENTALIASVALPLVGIFVYYMVSFGRRFRIIKTKIEKDQNVELKKHNRSGRVDEENSNSSSVYKYGLALAAIVVVALIGKQLRSVDLKIIMNDTVVWIEKQGNWGPVYYTIFLAVWVTLLLPCSILEVVPGFLFGFKIGWTVSVIGKSFGSLISLFLGRYFLASRIRGYVLEKYPSLKAFDKAVELEGFKVILMIRVAYLPMLIKNYGLSILDIPIAKIVIASFMAGIPFSAAWAGIGASSKNLAEIMEGKANLSDALPEENRELLAILAVVGLGSFVYVLGKFGSRFREIMAQVKADENKKVA